MQSLCFGNLISIYRYFVCTYTQNIYKIGPTDCNQVALFPQGRKKKKKVFDSFYYPSLLVSNALFTGFCWCTFIDALLSSNL